MTTKIEQKTRKGIRFYHPDHLGSTTVVTDLDGEVTQNVAYIPYGEVFVEQRNGTWNTPYLFNAKELDEETGLYYYGARYLDPTGTRWLSVDPLFEKYVGMTPYGYCAGNPVKLVDVDGKEASIDGEAGEIFVNTLQEKCKGITLYIEDGKIKYTQNVNKKGEKVKLNDADKRIKDIIDDKNINVRIHTMAGRSNIVRYNGDRLIVFGGTFLGNTFYEKDNEKHVDADQAVNPLILLRMDRKSGSPIGTCAMHELTEAYEGALISMGNGKSSPRSNQEGSVYEEAHKRASRQPMVRSSYLDDKGQRYIIPNSNCIKEEYQVYHQTFNGYEWNTVADTPYVHSK